MRRPALLVAAGLLATLTAVGTAPPALAHNVLVSSDPAKGAQLASAPTQVTLTFDQYVQDADVNRVAVTGPDGGQWAEGPVRVRGNVVTAPLRELGPAGEYTIGFRILSADGHSVGEELTFTLTKAGNGTPAAANPAKASDAGTEAKQDHARDSGGVPVWVWIAGAVVLLAAGLVLALRTGKPSDPGGPSAPERE